MDKLSLIQQIFAFLTVFAGGMATFWKWVKYRKTNEKKDILKDLETVLDAVSDMSSDLLAHKLKLAKSKTNEIQYKTAIERFKNACGECSYKIDTILTELNIKTDEN